MASAGNHRYAKALVFEESSDYNSGESNTLVCQNGILYFNGKQLSSNTGNQFDIFTANKVTRLSGANISWESNLVVLPYAGTISPTASAGQGFQSDGDFLYYNGVQISAFSNIYQDSNPLTSNSITPLGDSRFVVRSNLQVLNVMNALANTITFFPDTLHFANTAPKITFNSSSFDIQPENVGTNVQFLGAKNGTGSDCNVNFVSSNTANEFGTDVVNLKFKNKGDSGTASNNHTLASIKVTQTTPFNSSQGGGSMTLTARNPKNGLLEADDQLTMIHMNTNPTANTIILAPDFDAKVGIMAGYTFSSTFQIGQDGKEHLSLDKTSNTLMLGNGSKILTASNVWFQGTSGDRVTIGSSTQAGEKSVVIGTAPSSGGVPPAANVVSIGFGHTGTLEANVVKIGSYSTATKDGSISIGNRAVAGENGVAIGSNSHCNAFSVSFGIDTGAFRQGKGCIAIGGEAGHIDQARDNPSIGEGAVAIGYRTGNSNQGVRSVAIGNEAGRCQQGSESVAVGFKAGTQTQQVRATAIGHNAGFSTQGISTVAVGADAGYSTQQANAIAIGYRSGYNKQNTASISIGLEAGFQGQYANSVAIGYKAGYTNQKSRAVAVGNFAGYYVQGVVGTAFGASAGSSSQGDYAVAIGNQAGESSQNAYSVAIGNQAGLSYQNVYSVAIGNQAGLSSQESYAVAVGNQAGLSSQGTYGIAIGLEAGMSYQGTSGVAIGASAGFQSQGSNSIALGKTAGRYIQGENSVAIGYECGDSSQNAYSVAIGFSAASKYQSSHSIAIGNGAGHNSQNTYCVSMGYSTGTSYQDDYAIAIGQSSGHSFQSSYSVAIGNIAGYESQGHTAVAIGAAAGYSGQGSYGIAIGINAGYSSQNAYSVAIGYNAGNQGQFCGSIAVGESAGQYNQGRWCIAIGRLAGHISQAQEEENSIAIGYEAAYNSQGINCIALGYRAGFNTQGDDSVAIGFLAGAGVQHSTTIILNASGSNLNSTGSSRFHVKPIRYLSGQSNVLSWNSVTGEITCEEAKTFVIDHPDDKEKYLVHGCLEGPEGGVYYRGRGEVGTPVVLPKYVPNLIKGEPTIQVTPIYNGSVRTLNCSEYDLKTNSFEVFGTEGPFYWTFTAKRCDVNVEPLKAETNVNGNGPYLFTD